MNATLKTKAMQGIRTYLERCCFTVLEVGFERDDVSIDFVAYDEEEDELAFIECSVSDGMANGLPPAEMARGSFEGIAAAYLAEHEDVTECRVRFDTVSMAVIGEGRGFLRHHHNALCAAG